MPLPGTAQTYDLTVGVMLDFDPMIHLISPTDVPLLGGMGADGNSALSADTCFEKKVEWSEENLLLPRSTAAAAATTTEGVLTVASGHRSRFQTGDSLLLQGGNETARVTGYGTTTDTLLVTRGFNSTTSTAVATGDTITLIANILAEGTDAQNARARDRAGVYNMTQIFGPSKVQVSGSERAVRKYGVTDEFMKQAGNRTRELMIELEQAILFGARIEDTNNTWRAMGGLRYYITTNVDSTTTVLTETALLNSLQTCYDAGGNPDRIVVGSKQKRVISGFTTSGVIQVMRPDDTRGTVVDYYDSDFGRQTVILDRWAPTKWLFIFARDQATVKTLRPFQFQMLAKTGDADQGQVVGEKTLEFVTETHAALYNALT